MKKTNFNLNIKDKKVYIPLIIILVILLFIFFGNFINKLSNNKKYTSSANEVEFIDKLSDDIERKNLSIEAEIDENNPDNSLDCTSKKICVRDVKILCYKDRGVIEYTVFNNSSDNLNGGYLKLSIGDYNAVIWHDVVKSGASVSGFNAYNGFDLTDAEKYSISDIGDEEKSSIASFTYYSCQTPRVYYPLNYEGERIYRIGDDDVEKVWCRNKVEKKDDAGNITYEDETANVYLFRNPCAISDSNDDNQTETSEESDPDTPPTMVELPYCSEYDDVKLTIVG